MAHGLLRRVIATRVLRCQQGYQVPYQQGYLPAGSVDKDESAGQRAPWRVGVAPNSSAEMLVGHV
jgi:hypothetical protein